MNALDHLLADIKAAHKGEKLPRRPAACPQGQAPRPRQAKRPAAPVKRAAKLARPAPATQPAAEDSPIIARALAVLRAELGKVAP
ncbi:MAG: hypothetical protein HYY97_15885 [Rhodocyclales bacterium]|nr:hypothetical protein [Rhodocyclales bacterium]